MLFMVIVVSVRRLWIVRIINLCEIIKDPHYHFVFKIVIVFLI